MPRFVGFWLMGLITVAVLGYAWAQGGASNQGGTSGAEQPITIWKYSGGSYDHTFIRPREAVDGPCGDILRRGGNISGTVVEYADGTYLLEGYDCRLPKIDPSTSEPWHCEGELQQRLGAPTMVVKHFSLDEGQLSLEGEMEGIDYRYCFSLTSTATRTSE